MPGPTPKPKAQRRRRNSVPGARTLQAVAQTETPQLPPFAGDEGGWLSLTLAWWERVWSSPMAPEYTDADLDGLFILAVLVDQFYRNPDSKLAAEIRLQRQCFGLTPLDRRRLQWEVERAEEAQESSTRRKVAAKGPRANDPRLKAI